MDPARPVARRPRRRRAGRAIIAAHAGEARAAEALTTILAARGHALEEPHYIAAAVAPILEVCSPCGLVSTKPRNVPYYERLGFHVDAEVATPDGAAVMPPMHRAPSP